MVGCQITIEVNKQKIHKNSSQRINGKKLSYYAIKESIRNQFERLKPHRRSQKDEINC